MKKQLLSILAVLIAGFSYAQETKTVKPVVLSIGAELASPVGDLDNSSDFGIGGSLQAEFMVKSNLGITVNAGYINYLGKKYDTPIGSVKAASISQIPLLAGVRYYLIKDIYVSGQLGASIFNRDIGTAFTYAPGIGARASIFDLTLKYMGSNKNDASLSNVSLRVAVSF